MTTEELKDRTKSFAYRVIRLYRTLPKTAEADVVGKQVLRSATSVAANYRAATRARSRVEFIAKLGVVVEEIDETLFLAGVHLGQHYRESRVDGPDD